MTEGAPFVLGERSWTGRGNLLWPFDAIRKSGSLFPNVALFLARPRAWDYSLK